MAYQEVELLAPTHSVCYWPASAKLKSNLFDWAGSVLKHEDWQIGNDADWLEFTVHEDDTATDNEDTAKKEFYPTDDVLYVEHISEDVA